MRLISVFPTADVLRALGAFVVSLSLSGVPLLSYAQELDGGVGALGADAGSFDAAVAPASAISSGPTQLPADASLAVPLAGPLAAPLLAPAPSGTALDLAAAAPPSDSGQAPVLITVQATSATERLAKSADAVTVLKLTQARQRSSDLGEVLSRVPGITLRRFGGLGSEFRLALNGMYDTGVRVFVDGIPIDRVYAVGLANVPVNMIENVEVYRGVVPLRFGADALGGAINLVRPARYETSGRASYQVGSFGTHRATVGARYLHDATGLVAGVEAFFDKAKNDYFADVTVADARGRQEPVRVRRFHDAYQAYGAAAEVGLVDQSWARKLLAQVFTSGFHKEIQSNFVMTRAYGEPYNDERILGGLLTYENEFAERYTLEVVGSYTHRTIDFVDKSPHVYNWRGERVSEGTPGEIGTDPSDATSWQHSGFARARFDARIAPGHTVGVTISPSATTRTGDERAGRDKGLRDPLSAQRDLFKNVAGLGYTFSYGRLSHAPDDPSALDTEHRRFENVVFAKNYFYRARTEEISATERYVKRNKDLNRFGVGDSMRLTLVDDWLLTKASYEYATRLPDPDELFGTNSLVYPNLELVPEVSHNANLGLLFDLRRTPVGDFWVDLNLFWRDSKDMMVLLAYERYSKYENVYAARSLGVESAFKWTSPKQYVTLDGSFTYTDQRNRSTEGQFERYKDDRIPSRPYLHVAWGGFLHFANLLMRRDSIEPFYQGRYVGEYLRSWSSAGDPRFKQSIPSQLSHTLGVTYAIKPSTARLFGTFEVQNIGNAELFDTFGMQRPGRSYYFKLSGDI